MMNLYTVRFFDAVLWAYRNVLVVAESYDHALTLADAEFAPRAIRPYSGQRGDVPKEELYTVNNERPLRPGVFGDA
jgi:hypothetical protein